MNMQNMAYQIVIRALEKNKAQKSDKKSQGWGMPTLQSMVKKVFIDKVTFVQKLEDNKRVSLVSIWRNNISSLEESK